ncbi:ABC transporter substrate-binding protein [Falsirhodobacter sp. 20TX0035]|uniref:ABC transporter substrate-binding protein n=1 Tax=Falsirhodobacter sp. 20TX0035 TaxID=3022019 RepID=UPI00232F5A82|nr:ABC transporter substrate-binding protein [Falsirhodobacter sp. 20TX0035]MDB6452913.1 ABC transporter substrate-binding protein [Falsirhodobacter sp. 20TX0035]
MTFLKSMALAMVVLAAPAAQAAITLTDLEGRQVVLDHVPDRIALGFYFEDYLAVAGPGGADRLVALSRAPWADWRPGQWAAYTARFPALETLPDIGHADDGTLSAEAIIAARPDVAILSTWQTVALGDPGLRQLAAAGVAVVALDYNAQTVERHVLSTQILGAVLGQPERARQLADLYRAEVDDTLARVAKAGPSHRKVYVELAQGGPSQIGNSYGQGMWAGVIDLLGGRNIAEGQIGNWGPLSPEYVIAQQPDIILLAGSEWLNRPASVPMGFGATDADTQPRLRAYANRPGWADLPAVATKQVYGIYHGGIRTLSDFVYLRSVAKALYPDAFADVDPVEELRAFYAQWLPVSPDGLFVTRLQ